MNLFVGHQKKIMLAIDRLKRIMSGSKRLSTIDGQNRDSTEVLEPPMACIRWSGERSSPPPPAPPQYNELPPYLKPRRSSSGDSLSTNSSGEMKSLPLESEYANTNSVQKAPSVVPIKVKRSLSQSATNGMSDKEPGSQPKMCQSFHAPPDRTSDYSDRENTPTGDDYDQMSRSPMSSAPVAPIVAAKPKPVAMIVAKTKQSSREGSPDIIDVEKHEAERNTDGFKSPGTNLDGFKYPLAANNGSLKRRTSEHIYDTPQLGPPRTVSNYVNYSPMSVHQIQQAPGSPLHVSTQFSYSQSGSPRSSQQNSPGGRAKKAPPPPPKRNTSLKSLEATNRNGSSSPGIGAVTSGSPMTSVLSPPPIQQKPQIAASQAQAFVNCVQSLSEKFGKKSEENSCADSVSSDNEEPSPVVAMEIIEPKISNYGLLGKNDKATSGEYMLQQRLKRGSSSSSSPGNNTVVESAFGVKLRQAKTDTQIQNQSSEKINSSNQSNSSARPETSIQENVGNTAENAQVCVQKNNNNNSVNTESANSVTKESSHPGSDQDKQRKDSTGSGRGMDLSASTSSLDSNTLPFANENVGTIKQRAQQSKPSLVMVLDDGSLPPPPGSLEADCVFSDNMDTLKQSPLKLPKPQQPKVQSLQQAQQPKPQVSNLAPQNQSTAQQLRPPAPSQIQANQQRQVNGQPARQNGQAGQSSPNGHSTQQYNASATASYVPGSQNKGRLKQCLKLHQPCLVICLSVKTSQSFVGSASYFHSVGYDFECKASQGTHSLWPKENAPPPAPTSVSNRKVVIYWQRMG